MLMPVYLEVKFSGDPKELGFFLVQVAEFVQEWGLTLNQAALATWD